MRLRRRHYARETIRRASPVTNTAARRHPPPSLAQACDGCCSRSHRASATVRGSYDNLATISRPCIRPRTLPQDKCHAIGGTSASLGRSASGTRSNPPAGDRFLDFQPTLVRPLCDSRRRVQRDRLARLNPQPARTVVPLRARDRIHRLPSSRSAESSANCINARPKSRCGTPLQLDRRTLSRAAANASNPPSLEPMNRTSSPSGVDKLNWL